MDRADELVAPRRERRHVVGLLRDTREDLALEDARARRVLDLDVVGYARVLVVEDDLERHIRWDAQLGRVEGDVQGGDLDAGRRRRSTWCGTPARCGTAARGGGGGGAGCR